MTATPTDRGAIDAAIEAGQHGRAASLLRRLWSASPSMASAPFVIDRAAKLPAWGSATPCDLLLLRSFTLEPLAPLARAAAACWGVDLRVRLGQFNAYPQEILDPTSTLYTDPTDVVVLAVHPRDIAPELWSRSTDLDAAAVEATVARVVGGFRGWIEAIRSRSAAHLVVHNLERPVEPAAGVFDAQRRDGQAAAIERINAELAIAAAEHTGVYVLDYDGLVARHGRRAWNDEQRWLTVRMPIAGDCLIHLADEWLRYLLPLKGKQAKCLVCDLDNTLWGGVVGEDGVNGVRLGDDYPGAAYVALQRAIVDLTRRGVILAICSKNNEADALEAIDGRPEMLLRSGDFAAKRINWTDKAQNLREIAAELNIGVDALVLIDDNPVERELVREMVPEATVIDIDADAPLGHAAALRACPLFERLEVSAEDRKRNELYAAQQQRSALADSATTVEDYYRSLEMVATFGLSDEATRPRVAQLTQKTNQLNTTTRRYSEQQIEAFEADAATRVYWVRVEDRFGDNGVIGVVIAREESGDAWLLDTFLMSCRVIGRTVETAMLAVVAEHAREAGAKRLRGPFFPTAKNAPAKEIYASHRFRCVDENDDGSMWELDLDADAPAVPEWIAAHFDPSPNSPSPQGAGA